MVGRLRHQPVRLGRVRLGGHVPRQRIVQAQHRHCGAQHVHRRGVGHGCQKVLNGLRNGPVLDQVLLQIVQFGLVRQPAVPEQEDDFLKGGVVGQRMDVVAVIGKNAGFSIDVTNVGLSGDDAFKTCARCDCHGVLLTPSSRKIAQHSIVTTQSEAPEFITAA